MVVCDGSLSVNDGFRPCNFQKMIQFLFELGRRLGCGYVDIELFSDFFDVIWKRDFVEMIDEVINYAASSCF